MTKPASQINEIICLANSTELRCNMTQRVKREFRELRNVLNENVWQIMMDIQIEYAIGHKYLPSRGGYKKKKSFKFNLQP